MNSAILAQMRESIASGLKRKTLTTCSRWAENCVIMGGNSFPGPIKWDHHPWLKDMHDVNCEWVVGQKSAQMGFTVAALNKTLYNIDIHRRNCLYLLPTKTPDATDFSSTRFDPLLELSPHLAKLFSDVKNVATKRAGSATLYVRGANSRSGLKSIPVSFIVFDEFDEMPRENIPLAIERTSGQLHKEFWAISTPTLPEHGINKLFLQSTQEHFMFACPLCQRLTELIYPDSLVICGTGLTDPDRFKSHIICKECKGELKHEGKSEFFRSGKWVRTGVDNPDMRGFYINQMYSPTIQPYKLAESYFSAQSEPAAAQELYNSKLGLPYVADGARVDDNEIDFAIKKSRRSRNDTMPADARMVCMGVDVGKWLHVEISAYYFTNYGSDINVSSDCEVLWMGKVLQFEELDGLMQQWQVRSAVIDQGPEYRKALEFCQRWAGFAKRCFFIKGLDGKNLACDPTSNEHKVSVNRTSWLDLSLGRFHNKTISLPRDTPDEYRKQVKSPVRVYSRDKNGNPVATYISVSEGSNDVVDSANAQDHFAFARTYCEIALPLGASLMTNMNVSKFL